jgi:hypothetical protein
VTLVQGSFAGIVPSFWEDDDTKFIFSDAWASYSLQLFAVVGFYIVVNLVMMNMLISIVGEEYANILKLRVPHQHFERLCLFISIWPLIRIVQNLKCSFRKKSLEKAEYLLMTKHADHAFWDEPEQQAHD